MNEMNINEIKKEFNFLDNKIVNEPFIFDVLKEILSRQEQSLPEGDRSFATLDILYQSENIKIPFTEDRNDKIKDLVELLVKNYAGNVRPLITFEFDIEEASKEFNVTENVEYSVVQGDNEYERLISIRDNSSLGKLIDLISVYDSVNISKLIKKIKNKNDLVRVIKRKLGKEIFIFNRYSLDENSIQRMEQHCFHADKYHTIRDTIDNNNLKGIISRYSDILTINLREYGIVDTEFSDIKDTKLDTILHLFLEDIAASITEEDLIDIKNIHSLRRALIKAYENLNPLVEDINNCEKSFIQPEDQDKKVPKEPEKKTFIERIKIFFISLSHKIINVRDIYGEVPVILEKVISTFKTLVSGKRKIILVPLLLIIAVTSLFQYPCNKSDDKDRDFIDIQTGKNVSNSTGIEFFTIVLKDVTDEIDILGQIVFYEKVNMSSKVNGRLVEIFIQEGEKVSRGQRIAQIERLPLEITLKQQLAELEIVRRSYDLSKAKYENAQKSIDIKLKAIEKAKAELRDKKVTYQNMDRILKNKKKLYDAGGISESDLESLKAKHTTSYTKYLLAQSDLEIQKIGFRDEDIIVEGLKVPKSGKERIRLLKYINTKIERAELEAAKSKIKQVKKNIESTRILLGETGIRSPINGLVASKNMEAGEMVKQDSIIAVLINISRVFISMNVNEKDISKIKLGQSVLFTVDAIGDKSFKGIINRITPVLDVKTRTVGIKAIIDNSDGRLLPGMFSRARIVVGSKEKKLVVPLASIIKKDGDKGELYLVKKDILFKQKIDLGNEYKSDIEITKGLHPGDVIVSKGTNLVYPGMKVKPGGPLK